jgi:hypothetical protein
MNTQQPEALRLANYLDLAFDTTDSNNAAFELRRLHSVNVELLEALKGMARLYPPNAKARAAIAKAQE